MNYLSKNQQVQQEIRTFLGIDFQLITKLNKAIQINTILSQIVSPIQGRKIDNLCQCLQSTQVDIAMNQIPQHCAPRNNVNLACPVYAQINSPEDRIQAYTSILQVLQTNPNCLAIVHFANEGDPRKGGHACLVCGHTGNSLTIYNPDPAYAAANPYDIPALSYRAPSGIKKVATEYYIITW
ncbi:MAG: hypothetical protein LBF82_02010 [Lactobacillales bacterium]|nr:hypothetical protein [Lactobacillales bacterium]